jgi:hypothetical protein
MTNPVMADIRPDRNRPMVSDRHRTGRDLGSVGPVDPALGTGRRRLVGSDDRVRRPDTSGGAFARSSALSALPTSRSYLPAARVPATRARRPSSSSAPRSRQLRPRLAQRRTEIKAFADHGASYQSSSRCADRDSLDRELGSKGPSRCLN